MEMIRGSRCPRCGWVIVPPVRICPNHPVETEPAMVPGYGAVLSYTTLVSAPEGFKAPLQIALVELPEGARIFCHGKQERDLKIGRHVVIEQVDNVFYFAHLNLPERIALFWRRGGTARARTAGAVKGTVKRLVALTRIFRQGGTKEGESNQQATGRVGFGTDGNVIKTGGHEVSALEVEEQLRRNPAVAECAVVGVPDSEGGEHVAAAVVLREGNVLDLEDLRSWAKERLVSYKIPPQLLIVDTLPRDAMGKVMKPAVVDLFKSVCGSDHAA